LGGELASLEREWIDFQEVTIRDQRRRATGRTFTTLQLASGREFQQASVAAIDDGGVTIRHANGSAKLRYADLDAGQQVFFGLEADTAHAAELRESRSAIAYERGMEQQMAAIQEQEQRVSSRDRRGELAVGQERPRFAAAAAAVAPVRALAQPATRFGGRSWGYSSYSYRSYRPTYRYVYHYGAVNYDRSYPAAFSPQQAGTAGGACVTSPAVVRSQTFADTLPSIP
jgi:hypothetical protein